MGKFNYNLYKVISSLKQENLHESLRTFLEKRYGEDMVIEMEEHFLFAVGNIPICLVAHLDTVHKSLPHQIFYDKEEQVIWSPQGIGADDRAGVYAIMELIKRGLRPYVLFTWDEEVGAYGAHQAGKTLKDLGIVDFCIELDRRGQKDSVYYECDNKDFEQYINSFGFDTSIGSFSDICYICPEWGVAGVNLSIGYENEHTKEEILHVDWMMDTIDKVEKICYNKEYDKEKFIFVEAKYDTGYWQKYFGNSWSYEDEFSFDKSNGYDDTYRYTYSKELTCDKCNVKFPGHKIVPMGDENYCDDCYDETFEYCGKCRSIYKKDEKCSCK